MPLPRPSGTRHHRSRCAILPSGTRARLPRHTADLRQMALDGLSNGVAARHGVRIDLEGDAHVSARDRQHVCAEVPVADDEVTKPATVEIAALGGQVSRVGLTSSSSNRLLTSLEATSTPTWSGGGGQWCASGSGAGPHTPSSLPLG